MENSNDHLLSTAKKALLILKSFTREEPELKVTDLAASLGLTKSNVSRLLATLASEGFVTKDPVTQKYRLGLSIIELHAILTSNMEIRREAEPYLNRLVDEIGETVNITVFKDKSVIDIIRINSKQPVQIVSHIHVLNPVHRTSAGKVFLAHQEEAAIQRYMQEGLEQDAVKRYRSPAQFRDMLHKVKEQGYAVSMEELLEGVATIAVPIWDYTGQVAYCLSILGPVHRFDPHNPAVIQKIKACAKHISRHAGYRGQTNQGKDK